MSGLATYHPDFPINEWDRLIEQATLTLNLLRTARSNPNLSAHAYLFGTYDFNAHPLAPPGTKVVLHKKADKRESWQYHGVEAWYVGPSLEHYRYYKCYVPTTGAIVDLDNVKLIQHDDVATQAIKDIMC